MDHLHTNTNLFKAQDIAAALGEIEAQKQAEEQAVAQVGFWDVLRRLLSRASTKKSLLIVLLAGSLINTLVLGLVDVIAVSGFIGDVGLQSLPWLWIGELLLSLLISSVMLQVIDRLPRAKMMRVLLYGLTITYGLLAGAFFLRVSTGILYPIMYLIYAQQALIFPLAFWNLANHLYSLAEARKLFPMLSSGELLGRLAGYSLFTLPGLLGCAEVTQYIIDNPALVMAGSAILFFAGLLTFPRVKQGDLHAQAAVPIHQGFRENVRSSLELIREVPFFRNMAALVGFTWLALTILLFNFYASVDEASAQGIHFQTVYSLYNIAVLVLPLLFQWTLSDKLLERIPPKVGYLFLPFTLLLSMGLVFFLPHTVGGIGALFIAMIVYRGWYMPLYQSLYKLVPQERRGRVRSLLGNISYTLGSLAAALVIGLALIGLTALDVNTAFARTIYLLTALGATLTAIVIAFRIRATYDDSLFSWRVARRARTSDVFDKLG